MKIEEKLLSIQRDLKCNKGQYNKFGQYNYRSCEDILESVKPLCVANKVVLTLEDELVMIGERYYIKATAILKDCESVEEIVKTAYAREEENKKGMDGSQVTGATSSYARKYALNGLFCIDDTNDADTNEYHKEAQKKAENNNVKEVKEQTDYRTLLIEKLKALGKDMNTFAKEYGINAKSSQEDFKKACEALDKEGSK